MLFQPRPTYRCLLMRPLFAVLFAVLLALALPASAWAVQASAESTVDDGVIVSGDGDSALIEGATFAASDFKRAQKGSKREIDGVYWGYTYYQGTSPDYAVAVAAGSTVLVYVPPAAHEYCDVEDPTALNDLKRYFIALDSVALSGGIVFSDQDSWVFTSDTTYELDGVTYRFAVEAAPESYYVTCSDPEKLPSHVDFLRIAPPDAVAVAPAATGIAALGEFLAGIDLSPLWVTLRTTGTAIVIIFVLGLAAAYGTLAMSKRAQDIFDTIFTIPMVLPPTVCGFLLLLLLGRNTALGQWFIDIGFPLIFSWQATVIAAVVVAFPLMYRSARGAFESLDPRMLDAARTLGWSNARIFFRLMLPLSWSSIAAGTVLSFARALGEFGATLFLAGNYVGVTRTIPIAIYFEWMSGNTDVAIFWTLVILVFSFFVILLINLWSRRTTKYRRIGTE